MATKAATKKVARKTATKTPKATKQADLFSGTYFYGVGRRKSSVAQVRLYEIAKNADAKHMVNTKTMEDFFGQDRLQKKFLSPLVATGTLDKFVVSVVVRGGGTTGQVEAVRHGIARALVVFDEGLRPVLKAERFLRRDPRSVERKKPGLKKARRATQWRKR